MLSPNLFAFWPRPVSGTVGTGPGPGGKKGALVGRSVDRSIDNEHGTAHNGPVRSRKLLPSISRPIAHQPSPIHHHRPSSKSSQGPLQSDYDGVGVRRERRGNGWNLAAKNYHSMRHRSINQAQTESRGASNREGGMTAEGGRRKRTLEIGGRGVSMFTEEAEIEFGVPLPSYLPNLLQSKLGFSPPFHLLFLPANSASL